jgi:ribosomal protein S12 methylthiotransferase
MELKQTVCLVSLGCAKNLVDSEVMLGVLARAGFTLTADRQAARIIIVNTCAFIEASTREAISVIFDCARYKQTGACRHLVVCGCLPQRYKDELLAEFPEVDLFLGTGEFDRIDKHLKSLMADGRTERLYSRRTTLLMGAATPRIVSTPAGSAYLKIAEGCSHRCTYCTIPLIRGPYRARSQRSIVQEAKHLAGQGVKELNLIAQDTTRYDDLAGLLQRLARIDGIAWLRLLYGHPASLGREILAVMAGEEKVCRYLDIPLQHIADPVLRRMGRKITRAKTEALIAALQKHVPGLALRTTFIVGFPGETDTDFEQLMDFTERTRFDHLGVFMYSDEDGTPAARLPGEVPEAVKRERRHRLMSLQRRISREKLAACKGTELTVLVEGPAANNRYSAQARSEFQAPEVDGVVLLQEKLQPGTMVRVRINRALTYDLAAKALYHDA